MFLTVKPLEIGVVEISTRLPLMVILIELSLSAFSVSVILTYTAVVLLQVYELFFGNSPDAEGGKFSAPEMTSAKGCGPCGILVPFTVILYVPFEGDNSSTSSTLFTLSPPFPG